jgi:hypothetical protein
MCIPWGLIASLSLIVVLVIGLKMPLVPAMVLGFVLGIVGGMFDSLPGNFWSCVDSKNRKR